MLRYDSASTALAVRGRLAQLGEHQLDKLGVTGSSPVPPTHRRMQAFFSAEAGIYVCMDDNAKTFTTLTLLIALCDQALDDLESSDGNSEPLQFLLGATR